MDFSVLGQSLEFSFFTWATRYVASHDPAIIFSAFFLVSIDEFSSKGHHSAYALDLTVFHFLKDVASTYFPPSPV